MTVPNDNARDDYNGNDATTVFPYTFKIFDDSDITVIHIDADDVETTLILDTDYSVDGVGDSGGGNVTYPLSGDPLATGARLVLLRILEITQETDLRNQGAFYAETHERVFDRNVMIMQQLSEVGDRSLKVALGSDNPAPIDVTPNTVLGFGDDSQPRLYTPSETGLAGRVIVPYSLTAGQTVVSFTNENPNTGSNWYFLGSNPLFAEDGDYTETVSGMTLSAGNAPVEDITLFRITFPFQALVTAAASNVSASQGNLQTWMNEVQHYPELGGETGVTDTSYPYGDIRRHGAKTTETGANNLTYINNAILSSNCVFIPNGTFEIAGGSVGWNTKNDVTLYGCGFDSKIYRSDAGTVVDIVSCNRVTVRGIFAQGTKTYVSGAGGIRLDSCTQFNVSENMVTKSSRQGINIYQCTYGTVANNIVTDCYQDGIMVRTDSSYVTVIGNVSYLNGGAAVIGEGIHLFEAPYNTVTGNICFDNNDHGIAIEGSAHSAVTGNTCRFNDVCGVSINISGVYDCKGLVIDGNALADNASDGIIVSAVDDVSITNNSIFDNGGYGIQQGPGSGPSQDRIITESNRIGGNTSGGIIHNWNNVDCVIRNNVLTGAAGHGILINRAQSVDTIIEGNSVKGFPTSQITDSGTTSRVRNNDVGNKLSGRATLASGSVGVTFAGNEINGNYIVNLSCGVNETLYITARTAAGFTINSSNASSAAVVDWAIVDSKAA